MIILLFIENLKIYYNCVSIDNIIVYLIWHLNIGYMLCQVRVGTN
jgi:hypothetical protein